MSQSPSIALPFALGSTVWHIGPSERTVTVTCPECAGTKAITVTTGTGATYTLKCHHCGPGYRGPTGQVQERVPGHEPRQVTLEKLHEWREGRATYLGLGTGLIRDDYLFATREECQACCDRLNAEQKEHCERRNLAELTRNREHLAFSVPYWRRELRQLEEKANLVRAQLGLALVEKAKAPKTRRKPRP